MLLVIKLYFIATLITSTKGSLHTSCILYSGNSPEESIGVQRQLNEAALNSQEPTDIIPKQTEELTPEYDELREEDQVSNYNYTQKLHFQAVFDNRTMI